MDKGQVKGRQFAILGSDRGLALGLFLLGVLSRIPFRSHMLFHWDSVNFALAVEKFDMLLHQPHPPGFFLYVLLGRAATQLAGDVNVGYVWISVVCSGLGAVTMFYLGRALFGRSAGMLTALLFLSSPSVWFHGEIALTYVLEAFMVTLLVLLWWLMLRETRVRWLVLGSIGMGLSGGFRLPSMVFLAPLYLYSLRKYSRKQVLGAVLLTLVCTSVWLLPSANQMGGLDRYIRAVFGLTSLSESASQKGLNPVMVFGTQSVIEPVGRLVVYIVYGLLGGLLPFSYLLVQRGPTWLRSWRRLLKDERVRVLALWLMPILIVWAPRVKASGHTLSFLPAFLLFAGHGLVSLKRDLADRLSWGPRIGSAVTAGILLVNLSFFLLAPTYLFGIRRVAFTTPSGPTIRYRDQYLSERVDYIEKNFTPPNTAVLVTGVDFRHPDFYLRDYTSIEYVEGVSPWVDLPDEIQTLVVFSGELNQVATTFEGAVAATLPSGVAIYAIPTPRHGGLSSVGGLSE